jgi:hypothetical protein
MLRLVNTGTTNVLLLLLLLLHHHHHHHHHHLLLLHLHLMRRLTAGAGQDVFLGKCVSLPLKSTPFSCIKPTLHNRYNAGLSAGLHQFDWTFEYARHPSFDCRSYGVSSRHAGPHPAAEPTAASSTALRSPVLERVCHYLP